MRRSVRARRFRAQARAGRVSVGHATGLRSSPRRLWPGTAPATGASTTPVRRSFCQMLLTNPAQALEVGYNGMRFALSNQEKELVLSIQAKSLSELASQINSRNGNIGQPAPLVPPLMQV